MIDFDLGVHLDVLPEQSLMDAMEWRNDPSIWRWTRQNDLISENDHLAWFTAQENDPSIKMYSIWLDREWIGVCGLTSINWQNRNAEFSLYLAPPFRGKSLSKPSLATLFFHGFKNLGLKSIWGETFENNPARKIFRDIGMSEDGRRRQFYWKDGHFWDAILYSVLSDEFLDKHGDKSCF